MMHFAAPDRTAHFGVGAGPRREQILGGRQQGTWGARSAVYPGAARTLADRRVSALLGASDRGGHSKQGAL